MEAVIEFSESVPRRADGEQIYLSELKARIVVEMLAEGATVQVSSTCYLAAYVTCPRR